MCFAVCRVGRIVVRIRGDARCTPEVLSLPKGVADQSSDTSHRITQRCAGVTVASRVSRSSKPQVWRTNRTALHRAARSLLASAAAGGMGSSG